MLNFHSSCILCNCTGDIKRNITRDTSFVMRHTCFYIASSLIVQKWNMCRLQKYNYNSDWRNIVTFTDCSNYVDYLGCAIY